MKSEQRKWALGDMGEQLVDVSRHHLMCEGVKEDLIEMYGLELHA